MAARQKSANFLDVLRIGIIFGVIEAVTPVIG
jgi:putative Mn2+ efflux pump MntP